MLAEKASEPINIPSTVMLMVNMLMHRLPRGLLKKVSEFLRGDGLSHIEIHKTQPTIEDCFIKLLKN